MSKIKLVLTAAVAMVVMAFAVSNASAFSATIAPGGAISANSGSLTFSDGGGLIRVVCAVTLSGSLSTSIASTAPGTSFGNVSGVRIASCTGGSAVALTGTPWDLRINTVLGTQPNGVTGLLFDVVGASFQVSVSIFGIPVNCLYSGTAGALFPALGSNPYTTSTITVLGNTVNKAGGAAACPSTGRLNGTFALSPTQTITII